MCIYDVYGPCSCPHGRCFTVLAQFFAVGSWITSVIALTSCFYINVRPIPDEGEAELPKEGFGWMSRQIKVLEPPAYGKQCTWYTAEERALYFDGMWNAGFAMAILTVIIGLVVVSIVLCTCCVAFQLPTFDGLFWTCAICFVAQALTFLSWGSELCEEMECTWSSGTGMNLTAAMMWIWAANMIKSFPEALPPRTRETQRHEDYEEDEDDDGRGDVYLSNRDAAPHENDGDYRDNEYGDWDQDKGDGYYDEDGNWVVNDNSYSENDHQYDSYDDYDGEEGSNRKKNKQQLDKESYHSGAAYSDYDNDSNSNWAEGSEADNFDENAPMEAPPTQEQRRIPKKKKKDHVDGDEMAEVDSLGSYDNNDEWDDERFSFKYT